MFICGTGYMPARHSFESLFNVNMLFVHVFTLKDGSKIGCCNQKHATDPVHKHQVENNPEYFLKKKKKKIIEVQQKSPLKVENCLHLPTPQKEHWLLNKQI